MMNNACPWCGNSHKGGPEHCDDIPMRYKEGDIVQLTLSDNGESFVRLTTVVATAGNKTLLVSGAGAHYELDNKTSEVKELGDEHRCRDCGLFDCYCHNKKETMPRMTKIKDLEDEDDGYQIAAIEGKLVSLWEAKPPNDPKYSPQQNGVLRDKDGDEHMITFAAENQIRDMSDKGKSFIFSSSKNARGMTGVKLKVNFDKKTKKEYRKIWVTATAEVECLDGSQSASRETSERSESRQSTERAVQGSDETSTVKRRIFDYFRILSVVAEAYDAMKDEYKLPEMGEEGLRAVATGISMSYKGQYGAYAPPYFGPKDDPEKEDGEPAFIEEEEKKPSPPGWRDFVHPSSGRTLGDFADNERGKLLAYIAWGLSYGGDNKDARKFQANLALAAADLKVKPKAALEASLLEKLEGEPNMNGLDKYADDTFGVTWDDMTDEDSIRALKDIKALAKFLSSYNDDDIPG